MESLLTPAEQDWSTLLACVESIPTVIFDPAYARTDVTGEAAVLEKIQPSMDKFLKELPGDLNGKAMPDFYSEFHPCVPEAKNRMAQGVPLVDE